MDAGEANRGAGIKESEWLLILVGNRRGGAAELARHLMNIIENDHVHIHEMRGFVAADLDGAYHEAFGISRGTRCKKFLYSLSLSPPQSENVPVEVFEAAIDKIERKLGFTGQPRTIVFHEKKGRRHAHCVWSRIDAASMKAIDPYQDKLALESIARELFLEHGWNMPPGLIRKEDIDPFNYSHGEYQQAKRTDYDPKKLKQIFAECWQSSDSKFAFAHALKEHGFILARGDRRGHVAVGQNGEVYAISRWVGVKAKEVRAKLGNGDDLPSVDEALQQFGPSHDDVFPQETDLAYQRKLQHLEEQRLSLVAKHREARADLEQQHQARRITERIAQTEKIPAGLKAAWLKLSGQYHAIIKKIEADAFICDARDRAEYQVLIESQLEERRALQRDIERLHSGIADPSVEVDLASRLLKIDPAQKLIIPLDPETLGIGAKVRSDPTHILKVITDKKESFSRPDIVHALAKHIDEHFKLGNAVDSVMCSAELVEIQDSPLPRYSTREMLAVKAALSNQVIELSQTTGTPVKLRHVNAVIARQNTTLQQTIGVQLSDQQQKAIRHCLGPEKIAAVVGLAGAGKSTMLSAVREAYEQQGYRVRGAALSGKATDGLESASGIECRTLASLERSWKKGYSKLSKNDVLVIDEAGMIGTRQMYRFIEEVQNTGAKIIMVGDPEQLQPINAGTPFKEIAKQINAVNLTEIHRQKKDWQKQAALDLAEQRTDKALDAYDAHGSIKQAHDTSEAIINLVEDYMIDLSCNGDSMSRLALAHRRKDVHAINQTVRAARQSGGKLSGEVLISTDHGKRAFAIDDRILLTRNDHTLGVRNGMIGTVKSVSEDKLAICIDANGSHDLRMITINPKLYSAFDHGYATTIHKSQGATIDNTYVLGSVMMDRHLTYVAMTRHKQDTRLYGDYNSLQKMRRSGKEEKPNELSKHRYQRRPRGPTMH